MNIAQALSLQFCFGSVRRIGRRAASAAITLGLGCSLAECALADPFPQFFRSGTYLGRGNTGIADADNHEAIFYNPAGIAKGSGIYKESVLMSATVEVSSASKDLIRQMVVEKNTDADTIREFLGKNQHLGIYGFSGIVLRRAAFGVFTSVQGDALPAKSYDEGGLETLDFAYRANYGLVFSVAEQFLSDTLQVGTTIKYTVNNSADMNIGVVDAANFSQIFKDVQRQGSGFGADIGVMYQLPTKMPMTLGLTIADIGDSKFEGDTKDKPAPDSLPQTINFGSSITTGTGQSTMQFLLDVRDLASRVEDNIYKKIHLGAEISFKNIMGFSAGLNQGYPALGAFLDIYALRVDVGVYGEEVGDSVGSRPDQRLFFKIFAGF